MKVYMNLSVIIPIYNIEKYLPTCINSVLNQEIDLEVILVDDGSTDKSYQIAEQYSLNYDNIILISQQHSGPSIARNQGLEIAKGEYIAFIDSDDWVSLNSLSNLYIIAKQNALDMVLGNMIYHYPDGNQINIFDVIPAGLKNKTLSGRDCFISLMETGSYYPMACSFICKRSWIEKHNLKFDKYIIHEDEIWTQIALCLAGRVMLTDMDFYYYRKREGSIMHTLDNKNRLKSLFYIANRFIVFASQLKFEGKDNTLKSWIYVNTYRIYKLAFSLLADIKDSSFKLPKHYLYSVCRVYNKMAPKSKERMKVNYRLARIGMKNYLKWKLNPWNVYITQLTEQELSQKKIILIYNNPEWYKYESLEIKDFPENYIITTDRKYYNRAYAVVFHLPDLLQSMEHDLEKSEGQLWIAWNMECEENYPWMKDDDIKDLFDIRMNYHLEADIVCSYIDAMCSQYVEMYKKRFLDMKELLKKENKICMLISSQVNQSGRIEYLKELMQYIDIDSYGKLYNNKKIEGDNGRETKLEIYSKYKFVIAFENAIGKDYVTEKFYDPLLAGSVPVYMGAPNIEEFVPGDNCYINANDHSSTRDLADYLKRCLNDDEEYMKYHKWKNTPLRKDFVEKVKVQDTDPFIRLCEFLNKKNICNTEEDIYPKKKYHERY